LFELSERQIEILVRISRGETYQAIATELFLSPATVSYHVANLQRIFQARGLPSLVAKAVVAGVLSSDAFPLQPTGVRTVSSSN
jgi:DNA-binding CsgD family transcriptional regulator